SPIDGATLLQSSRVRIWIGGLMNHLSLCQRMYIRSRRPFRIILMRHAESEGNVDKCMYSSTPDHALKITERGKRQATLAGRELQKLIGDESVYFIVSPYTRTRMTYKIVKEGLGKRQHFAMKEDPRLRELDFGNFQDLGTMQETMETRKAYGRFWFRFMNGESCSDVYDRATAFWESVFRSMDHSPGTRFQNYVIITHGLMMRLILMRYFQWKVEFFERVWNPSNCETWIMERDERGSYRLVTEILDRPPAVTTMIGESIERKEETASSCVAGAQAAVALDGEGSGAEGQGTVGADESEGGEAAATNGAQEQHQQQQEAKLPSPPSQAEQLLPGITITVANDPTAVGGSSGVGGSEEEQEQERQPIAPPKGVSLPSPPSCLGVATHVRGGASGVVDGGLFVTREEEEEEE
ncbi:unnamed protein product, partial [Ectocarpus sp. 12 AP-2014]